jgi:hypothetical protein
MTDVDHRRLLRVVMALPCPVLISGYASRLYAEMLKGWRHTTFQTMTRGARPATEWLWANFPEPVELHDYRYLGSGFRERERIKRKKQRWARRIEGMPILERQALLLALSETQEKMPSSFSSLPSLPAPTFEFGDATRFAPPLSFSASDFANCEEARNFCHVTGNQ